jgi:Fur family ferric uptake transcriptional regulator
VTSLPLLSGVRATAQRRAILRLVEEWQGGFTVADLHARARTLNPRLGLATTYRTIELLRRAGVVRAVLTGGVHSYVRCSPTHHHHLVCTTCGRVEETELCAAPPEAELRRLHGFRPDAHDLDIYGTCRACAA